MTDAQRSFHSWLHRAVPPWLSRRPGLEVGFRYLTSLVLPLDAAAEVLLQGLRSHLPGYGTPTALTYAGRSRGIIRGQGESASDYAARLMRWLDTWEETGCERRSAMAVHHYLATHPRVTVINRAGLWTVAEGGAITTHWRPGVWDWDSVSHPERSDPASPWWSDLWMIVSPSPWARRPTLYGVTGDDGHALGHLATHEECDAVLGLLAQSKGGHSRFRAVIWSSNDDLFDPDEPSSLPDGTWGAWSINVGGTQVPSGRNVTECRYWEPR